MLAVAAGLLVLAIGFVVPRLGDGGGDTTADTTRVDEDPSGVVLVCDDAVVAACEAAGPQLGVAVRSWAPGGSLPDRYVLVAARGDVPEGEEIDGLVGSSPIVIGVWLDRSSILGVECGTIDFDCLGGVWGRSWSDIGGSSSWGDVALGLADPLRSEAGLAAWAAVSSTADPADIGASLFLVSTTAGSLPADAVLRRSSADILVTTEAAIAAQLENAIGRGGRIEINYPASSPWVEYVGVAQGFGSGGVIDDLVSEEFAPLLAGAGLRPNAPVQVGFYPDAFGEPGAPEPVPSAADRGTLAASWDLAR